jgi:cytoskeletal protein CcmA (bactofilin family)
VSRLCPTFMLIPLLVALTTTTASAAEPARTFTLGDDRFMSGERVDAAGPVEGDLIVAGGEVHVDANTRGDLLAAGGDVRVSGSAGQDAYVAGGDVVIAGVIERNARVAGGTVRVAPTAQINGSLTAAGGEVDVLGAVGGYVQAASGRIFVNSEVAGDVYATGREIALGPQARIGGAVRYRGEIDQHPQAQVAGGVERLPDAEREMRRGVRAFWWIWVVGLILLAIILLVLMPAFTRQASDTARARTGLSFLVGLIALVAIPVLIVIAMITVVGLPVGLLLILFYFGLLLVGVVFTGIALGDAGLRRARLWDEHKLGLRIAGAAIALVVLALVSMIPFLGAVVMFVALVVGMGALLAQWRRPRAAAAA